MTQTTDQDQAQQPAPVRQRTYTREQSSNVAEIAYDDAAMTLDVKFHSGGHYRYSSVPAEVFDSALSAESIGKFVGQSLRGKFLTEALG